MPVCPLRVACSLPVATSHNLIVLSPLRGQRLAVWAVRHARHGRTVSHAIVWGRRGRGSLVVRPHRAAAIPTGRRRQGCQQE